MQNTSNAPILYQEKGHIAIITLNRPDDANALNIPLAETLLNTLIDTHEKDHIRAIVLTGTGKFFSAGGDLKSFASDEDKIAQTLHLATVYLHNVIGYIHRNCVPVVTAINGITAGAGVGFALSGDYAIAAQNAKFTLAYTNAGLSADCGTTYLLPRLVGLRKAQQLILNNSVLSAQQALDIGMISEVVAADDLQTRAIEVAEKFAAGPSRAFQQCKALLADSFNNNLEQQLHQEALGIAAMVNTQDGHEGVQAFIEKRKAQFTGK